jgi:hypothetical protein
MNGVRELTHLLKDAAPRLTEGEYVFVCVPDGPAALRLSPVGVFTEGEGITAICRREQAEAAGLDFDGVYRQLTLTVHSSLQAVGFLAAISGALAERGIPCNAVSAFYHDHIFVPAADADRALGAIAELSRRASDPPGSFVT